MKLFKKITLIIILVITSTSASGRNPEILILLRDRDDGRTINLRESDYVLIGNIVRHRLERQNQNAQEKVPMFIRRFLGRLCVAGLSAFVIGIVIGCIQSYIEKNQQQTDTDTNLNGELQNTQPEAQKQ